MMSMKVLFLATLVVSGAAEEEDVMATMQRNAVSAHSPNATSSDDLACNKCSDVGGCVCECSWAPDGCKGDDGSCCYACCCYSERYPAACPTDDNAVPDVVADDDAPAPAGLTLYCPYGPDDIEINGNDATSSIEGSGWTMLGGSGVNVKASFNLLGGYVEFDMDLTKVGNGVNTNLYTISPADGVANSGYCDIQSSPNYPTCMEWDIDENNGNCAMQTTLHTWPNHNGGCDQGGCEANTHIGTTVHIKASMSTEGYPTINVNGNDVNGYNPAISASSAAYVVTTMQERGAAIWSSQWVGWVPVENECPSGATQSDLDSSQFSISNLKIMAKSVVFGSPPALCGAAAQPQFKSAPPIDYSARSNEYPNAKMMFRSWVKKVETKAMESLNKDVQTKAKNAVEAEKAA